MDGTLIIIVLLVLLYVVVFLPRQRQVARQRAMQSALAVGDEVVTIGGMHGTVTGVESDAVRLELSPGVEVRFVREAVASRRAVDAPDDGATGDGPVSGGEGVDAELSDDAPEADDPSVEGGEEDRS